MMTPYALRARAQASEQKTNWNHALTFPPNGCSLAIVRLQSLDRAAFEPQSNDSTWPMTVF